MKSTRFPPRLMLMGTGSDVGKSLLVAGLCRAFKRRGLRVRPFKPQNMSNNAAVTFEGGEIGRAQALQARAAGLEPSQDMNPVLLKPQSEIGAQVVIQGKVWGTAKAREYQGLKGQFLAAVLESFDRLSQGADLLLIEGAGSASEVNLRAGDIANWGFALATRTPVVLVGDIDRGGVIASLVGTQAVIGLEERALLKGYLINRFRGDTSLFDTGHEAIHNHTGWKTFGTLPHWSGAHDLPAEDALALEQRLEGQSGSIRIGVLAYPRVSNFDDFDPLAAESELSLSFIRPGQVVPGNLDWLILPGSKSTRADLTALRKEGWDLDLKAHLRRGGRVLGVCGGYQMLGETLSDPEGLEGPAGQSAGLGLLALTTRLEPRKVLAETQGQHLASGTTVRGFHMHMGRTQGPDQSRALFELDGETEGAASANGQVMGTYVHGLFASDTFRRAFFGLERKTNNLIYETQVETRLDELADLLETHLDLDALLALARTEA